MHIDRKLIAVIVGSSLFGSLIGGVIGGSLGSLRGHRHERGGRNSLQRGMPMMRMQGSQNGWQGYQNQTPENGGGAQTESTPVAPDPTQATTN